MFAFFLCEVRYLYLNLNLHVNLYQGEEGSASRPRMCRPAQQVPLLLWNGMQVGLFVSSWLYDYICKSYYKELGENWA